MAVPKAALVVALIAWLPTYWLAFSNSNTADYSSSSTVYSLASAAIAALCIAFVLWAAWRLVFKLRAAKKAKKELKDKKVRLWNKLSGGGSAVGNAQTLCIMDYLELKGKIQEAQVDPVDTLEAFQAKTLLLDEKYSKIKEVVYDADVQAFLLFGREKETLIPASTFYMNYALSPSMCKDEDGEEKLTINPIVSKLQEEGALPVAIVDKEISTVCSLLLNHGAHFYIGQFSKSSLAKLVASIAKRPIFAAVLASRDIPSGQCLAVLSCDAGLLSLVVTSLTPGARDHIQQEEQVKHRVGYAFVSQRQSSTHGKRMSEASVRQLLDSAGQELVSVSADSLLSKAGDVRAEVDKIFERERLTALAIVAGSSLPAVAELANSMDISIFSLTDHLTEVYLCLPLDRLNAGLSVSHTFGKAIRL